MNINWKLRLHNKATISALVGALVVCAYSVAKALGLELPVEQQTVMDAVSAVLTLLCGLGIVVDPTTEGVSDSERAMGYEAPARGGE